MIPAKPGEIKRSPKNKKQKGIPCENKPTIHIFQRTASGTEIERLLQIIKKKIQTKAKATRTAAENKGGHSSTTILMPMNEPLQNPANNKNNR